MTCLGLDLGASGIRAYRSDSAAPLAQISAGPSSAARDKETIELINELSNQIDASDFSSACLGMSGFSSLDVDHNSVAQAIAARFRVHHVIVTSDMVTSHYAHFQEESGVSTVVGTGSLSFGVGDSGFARIDGLGGRLGDFGSAHWIGFEAMRRAKRESELGKDSSLLFELEQYLGNSATWPVRLARQEITTFEIAKLAQIVDSLSGNPSADQILHEAGELAAESAIACSQRVSSDRIGFGGSVLKSSERVRESFISSLDQFGFKAEPISNSSGLGAAMMACSFDSPRVVWLETQGLLLRRAA